MHHTYLSFLNLTANDGEWLISNALKSGQNCAKKVGRMRGGELELGVDYWCDALSWASHSAVQCIIAVCRGQRSGAKKPLSKNLQGNNALPCIDFSQIIVCPRPPVSECRRLRSWAI